MTQAQFTLSAFGDEIAVNLYDQLRVLNELNIGYLELRGVWNKNVLELDDEEARKVRALCDQHGVRVSAIGSPIGKSPIGEPIADDVARLERIMRTGEIVGTRSVRVFSYYPAEGDDMDALVPAVAARLATLAARAAQEGYELLLENEKGIVGDTISRCAALLQSVGAPNLRFAWDPANFVQVDEAHATDDGWPLLGSQVGHVHIKDARLADGSVHPAGQGDGQVPELLTRLKDAGYVGYLALEPHLAIAGHSSGFSGPDGMAHAAKTLRAVMAATGCVEVP
jgi:sugar phosphate isomerase/epimerase